MVLEVNDLQSHLEIDLDLLCRALCLAAGEDGPDISLSIVDDAEIQALNKRYLGHDRPTDVIAFDYSEESEGNVSGEVIVSAETALRVASRKGLDPIAELVLYAVHGTLHLIGFDDADPEGAAVMWRRQGGIMKELGFTPDVHP